MTDETERLISTVLDDPELTESEKDRRLAHVSAEDLEEYARKATQYAERVRVEAELFGAWADEQRAKGREESALTFGNFIREMGYLREEPEVTA